MQHQRALSAYDRYKYCFVVVKNILLSDLSLIHSPLKKNLAHDLIRTNDKSSNSHRASPFFSPTAHDKPAKLKRWRSSLRVVSLTYRKSHTRRQQRTQTLSWWWNRNSVFSLRWSGSANAVFTQAAPHVYSRLKLMTRPKKFIDMVRDTHINSREASYLGADEVDTKGYLNHPTKTLVMQFKRKYFKTLCRNTFSSINDTSPRVFLWCCICLRHLH